LPPCWRRFEVRPDPGRPAQEAVIAAMTSIERTARMEQLRANGRWLVWRQVDAAGIVDPIEVAAFVLRRLYPDASAELLDQILEQLGSARAAGTWNGFARPDPENPDGDS
jgi:hypothetical protein